MGDRRPALVTAAHLLFGEVDAVREYGASADQPVRLPLPVEAFLLADPFVSLMTALSTHTVYRGLLWSVGLIGLTLVFGRVFCGWICP